MNQRTAEPIDLLQPKPVVEVPGADPLPQFALYPLPEQVADKLCAMYATYRDAPSSRYRDLVDLVFVITSHELDAARTVEALRGESLRRQLQLPTRLAAPGPQWEQGYRATAADTNLPSNLHVLDAALMLVGVCLEPLLSGATTTGIWNPLQLRWDDDTNSGP